MTTPFVTVSLIDSKKRPKGISALKCRVKVNDNIIEIIPDKKNKCQRCLNNEFEYLNDSNFIALITPPLKT